MQIPVNSANIGNFGFSVLFDIYNRTVLFDTTALTTYNGSGASNVLGIAFSVIDQDGVTLASVDWTTPQIPHPNLAKTWTLDLSAVNFPFLYQSYQIIGYIKDSTGLIYQTLPVIKKVCEPVSVNESGYVPGTYQVIPDCTNNVLTVKELTLLVYSGKTPTSTSKTGTLYYPTGTINPVTFTSTPFSNNQIITGENRIVDTTVATYDLLDDVYVNVTYKTDQYFPVTCNNVLGDLSCCLIDLQNTANKHCNDAIGENARQLMSEVSFVLMSAMVKQVNGQDASSDVAWIKKKLNCNCGATSMQQNQSTPINPAVTSIVLTGAGGTSIAPPTINGTTKSFVISSNVYQVVKGDVADLAWDIVIDTATTGNVKYKISFNYTVMAGYLLTAIGADSGLTSQLNSLVSATTNIDLSALNGGCVIDLSSSNYFLSFLAPSIANTIKSIKINGTTYTAPTPLLVNNTSGITSWLNGLSLSTFTVSYNAAPTGGYLNILSSGNANTVNSAVITVSGTDTTVAFQKTNQSLIAFLQAVVNYLCNITSLQVALGQNIGVCQFDYSGNVVVNTVLATQTQGVFNASVAGAICNIISRINTVSSITCNSIKALFNDNPAAMSSGDRILGILGGVCASLTSNQVANAVIAAIKTDSTLKSLFCGIGCGGGSVSASFIIGTTHYNICGTTPVTLYSASSFAPGVAMYYDAALTSLVTGYLFIAPVTTGLIYGLDPTTAIVGAVTVYTCVNPVNNAYFKLGNSTDGACAAPLTTSYFSGTFGPGTVLYIDPALTILQTGYIYALYYATGVIFNLNNTTAVVGSDSGASCGTPTYDYFLANKYDCSNCGVVSEYNVPVAFPSGYVPNSTKFYIPAGVSTPTYSYKIISTSTMAVSEILSVLYANSCAMACSGV